MLLRNAKKEFLEGYFSTHDRRGKTRSAYHSDLEQFQNFAGTRARLASLDGSLIERWAGYLKGEQYSPASIRRKMVTLRVFCSYWVRKGILPESPFWRVKLSYGRIEQLPRTLTENEMKALLRQAHRNRSTASKQPKKMNVKIVRSLELRYRPVRDLALVDLLFATGMRVGEVSALDVKDFSSQESVFRVQGKGGRDRLAFAVDEKTVKVQQAHLRERERVETDSPALFLNASGTRLSTQGIANVISQLRREAGIERHITPHMLRHTVATLLLRNGADIRVVQEFLGHTSIATTQRYTHITKEHMISVLRKRHPSFALRAGR